MWMLIDSQSGEIVRDRIEEEPRPPAGQQAVRRPRGAGYTWSPAARAFQRIRSMAEIEADLIAEVKAEAERRKMLNATPGGYKKTDYSDQRREVDAWETQGGTLTQILAAFALLSTAARWARFPYTMANAEAFGDTPQAAQARFRAGINGPGLLNARIAAIEAKTCAAIRAATTAPGKRAAAAAASWPA